MCMLLSGAGKHACSYKKMWLNAGAHEEMHSDITFILKVGSNLLMLFNMLPLAIVPPNIKLTFFPYFSSFFALGLRLQ